MTPVAEQEKVMIDINIEEDTGKSMDMEWEVETEPAEPLPKTEVITGAPETYYEQSYDDTYDRAYTRTYGHVMSYNKHLFTWLFSFFLGVYGVDRFLRGQIGLGILKLFTGGGFGFLYMYDLIVAIYKSYAGEYREMDDLLFDANGNFVI